MKNRNLVLILALVVLIGVYWFMKKSEPVVKADRPFMSVDSAKVDLLRMEMPDDTVELQRIDSKWWVTVPTRYPAAEKTVESAIQRLRDMKKLSLITERPERFSDFQVADSAATLVTVGEDGKTTTFILGKAGPTFQTSYARFQSSQDVWEVSGNNAGVFKRKSKEWRDKTITDLDMNSIDKVVIEYPKQDITLTLNDSIWTVDAGKDHFVAGKDLVERLTRMISRISAVDFVDTLSQDAFDHPEAHIVASLSTGGEPVDLKLIPKDAEGNQYFLRKEGALADFVIYKSTANALMKKPEDFEPKDESAKPAVAKSKTGS